MVFPGISSGLFWSSAIIDGLAPPHLSNRQSGLGPPSFERRGVLLLDRRAILSSTTAARPIKRGAGPRQCGGLGGYRAVGRAPSHHHRATFTPPPHSDRTAAKARLGRGTKKSPSPAAWLDRGPFSLTCPRPTYIPAGRHRMRRSRHL